MAAPEAPMLYQGVPRSSAAFRLLKQMGWQEGEGLGKEKQGISEHVRVTKKKDNSGIGVDAQQKAASNWTFNTTAFDNILKNLKVIAADKDKEDADKKEEERDGGGSGDSKLRLKKATRPQGRYKNREYGKVLKGKSQADLDAILGFTSKQIDETSIIEGSSMHKGEGAPFGSGSNSDSDADDFCNGVDEASMDQSPPAENVISKESVVDWWGTKHGFVHGGLLGDLAPQDVKSRKAVLRKSPTSEVKDEPSNCRSAFCEQDQENLYKLVQDKSTKGRQGLGIADRPKKIGGAHWKGQKLTLDASDDDSGENQEPSDIQEDGRIKKLSCIEKEHKRKTPPTSVLQVEGNVKLKKLRSEEGMQQKWKKLCKSLLSEVPDQTMSIKRLYKQIVGVCDLLPTSDGYESEQPLSLFKEKLSKSSKFSILGKKVCLVRTK